MGKSLKNAVNPDEVCDQYGADTLRLYEMYMGPLEASQAVEHPRHRRRAPLPAAALAADFVDEETARLLVNDEPARDERCARLLHKTIKRVTDDMERLRFNTAIAGADRVEQRIWWRSSGCRARWPSRDRAAVRRSPRTSPRSCGSGWGMKPRSPTAAGRATTRRCCQAEQVELPVQVNGKVRGRITVPADADEEAMEAAARDDAKVQEAVGDATIRKVIVVNGAHGEHRGEVNIGDGGLGITEWQTRCIGMRRNIPV